MFDFGFSELLLIAVVALVVLGPERLPKAARFVGLWVRRARAQWYSVKNELERELAAEELKRDLHDAQAAMRGLETDLRNTSDDARREFEAMREQTLDGLDPRPMRPDDDAPEQHEQEALEHDADTPPPAVTPSDGRDHDEPDRAAEAQAAEDAPDMHDQDQHDKDAARDGHGR